MSDIRAYPSDVAFTPAVKAIQTRKGSRDTYARVEQNGGDLAFRLERHGEPAVPECRGGNAGSGGQDGLDLGQGGGLLRQPGGDPDR